MTYEYRLKSARTYLNASEEEKKQPKIAALAKYVDTDNRYNRDVCLELGLIEQPEEQE